MLLLMVLCQALADEPADALRFENRSELAMLSERLAVLESQAARREARNDALQQRLRQVEHQQPIHRRVNAAPMFFSGGEWRKWDVQWLQSEFRWEPNGELSRQEPQALPSTEPQPHRIRGEFVNSKWSDRYGWMRIGNGPDIADYWIVPPLDFWSDPLDHGLLIGTDAYRVKPKTPSFLDLIDELLRSTREPYGYEMAW